MKTKLIYIIGSLVIGIVGTLGVYFGLLAGGVIEVEQTKIVFASESKEKVYDGTALVCEEWSIVKGKLKDGHKAKVVVSGSLTDVGTDANYLAATIVDAGGADVSKEYVIEYQPGVLSVAKKRLDLTATNASKVYDGTPLTANEYTITGGEIINSHAIEVKYLGSQTDAGTGASALDAVVRDRNGKDVSFNYDITTHGATLTVDKRPLTVKSADGEKTYDGTALVVDTGVEIVEGGLVEGQTLGSKEFASPVNVGKSKNTFVATVFAGETDVSANYTFTYETGELVVLPREISIRTFDDEKIYDGKVIEVSTVQGESWEISAGELVEGQFLAMTFETSDPDVGKVKNEGVASVSDEDGTDLTENYKFTYQYGTLSIQPRPIIIQTDSGEQEYNGEAFKVSGYKIEDPTETTGLIEEHEPTVIVTGEQTDAGNSKNTVSFQVFFNGVDKTENYKLDESRLGTLKVSPKPLHISTGSNEKTYDGEALISEDYEVTETDLVGDDYVEVRTTGAQISAGEGKNTFTAIVYNQARQVVSDNYKIVETLGVLKVNKRPITVETANKPNIEYDGQEHSASEDDWTLASSTPLLEGHTISVVVNGRGTDVGTYTNEIASWSVSSANGDETNNYALTKNLGKIVIVKKKINVETITQTVVYNGVEQFANNDGYLLHSELVENHAFSCTVSGHGTNAGNYEIFVNDDWKVVDTLSNTDKTANYEIVERNGKFIINPRRIVLQAGSAEQTYDGTALTKNTYQIIYGSLLSGHSFETVMIDGSQTMPGESDNEIGLVVIKSAQGEMTANYEIGKKVGKLVVHPAQATNPDDGQEEDEEDENQNGEPKINLNTPGGGLDGKNTPEMDQTVLLELTSNYTSPVYLRQFSYAEYLGAEDWNYNASWEYAELLNGTYSMNYLTSFALQSTGAQEHTMTVKTLYGGYFLPYFTATSGANYKVQTSDIGYAGDQSEYSLNYCYYYFLSDIGETLLNASVSEYSEQELAYRSYVYRTDRYLQIPASTKTAMDKIIQEQGFTKDDPYFYLRIAKFIQESAYYTKNYPTGLDTSSDPAVEFLTLYKKGVCRHYATSATMLFRALGVPARYVTGFSAETIAGQTTYVLGKQAHAWVEIYLDGLGWVMLEVTGSGEGDGGGGESNPSLPKPLPKPDEEVEEETEENEILTKTTLFPITLYHKHDGTPLVAQNKLSGFEKLKEQGYTYTAVVEGEQTAIGYGKSKIVSFTLYDKDGVEIPQEQWAELGIEIQFAEGRLHVYDRELTVKTGSSSKVYDGTPLICKDYTLFGQLLDGHKIGKISYVSRTTEGTSTNVMKLVIVDEQGNDVSYYYKIAGDYGSLYVSKREITLTACSLTVSKESLNGGVIICPKYTISSDYEPIVYEGTSGQKEYASGEFCAHLGDGHYIVVQVQALKELSKIGRTDNQILSYTVYDKDGKDVSANYKVNKVKGILKITK